MDGKKSYNQYKRCLLKTLVLWYFFITFMAPDTAFYCKNLIKIPFSMKWWLLHKKMKNRLNISNKRWRCQPLSWSWSIADQLFTSDWLMFNFVLGKWIACQFIAPTSCNINNIYACLRQTRLCFMYKQRWRKA